MYIYFHIYTCICIHITNIHMIIQNHTYIHVYIHNYIKGNTHIPIKKCLLYFFPATKIWKKNRDLPRSGAASVGVKKVNSLEELQATYEALDDISGWEKSSKSTHNKSPTCYHENQLRAPKKMDRVAFIVPEVIFPG